MKALFETLTVLALVLLCAACALWLQQPWNVTLNGAPLGLWVPVTGMIASMILALGLVVGWNFEPRAAPPPELTRDITRGGDRARPLKFTVKKGKRYQANIQLSFFEQVASNDMIAGMLQKAGFSDVKVTGSGGSRRAEATWPGDDQSAEMPAQIVSAAEIAPKPTQVATGPAA